MIAHISVNPSNPRKHPTNSALVHSTYQNKYQDMYKDIIITRIAIIADNSDSIIVIETPIR